ncbi:MAG: arylsulfatase [Planctomycetes bacterium]|nr:arylsulfatase [Planctomycetota bacterium]
MRLVFMVLGSCLLASGEVSEAQSLAGGRRAGATDQPNIVLIYADDLGYGDLGCYGASLVQTPNIDRLARGGRLFTDAHSASAVCSPSRYGLLTGDYPLRRNLWGPIGWGLPLSIDPEDLTLGRALKKAGYATACVGKWHLGLGEKKPDWNGDLAPGPLELGFDYYFGVPVVNSSPPFVYVEGRRVVGLDPADPFVKGKRSVTQVWPAKGGYKAIGGARRAHELYRDERIATTLKDKAISWMKRSCAEDGAKPFFLYLATTNIHHPFTPAPRFKGKSKCGRYGDFILELDWVVGEVLGAIDALGKTKNTLVVFTSDNGGMLNRGGQDAWRAGHRLNGKLLGFKFGAWEGGHRVPFIAKWPGRIPAATRSEHLIGQVDLLATLAAAAGRPVTRAEAPDSLNQLPTLLGRATSPVRQQLIISPNSPKHLVVRKGKWAFIPARDEGGFRAKRVGDHTFGGGAVFPFTGQVNSDFADGRVKSDAPPAQLYDLSKDLAQTTNLYAKHPEIVVELEAILRTYRAKIGPGKPMGWIDGR